MHRLGAISRASLSLDLAPYRLPHGAAEARRNVDLVAELAGEADPHEPCGNSADARRAHAHMREGVTGEIDVFDERRDAIARSWPLHGDHRPLLGGRSKPDR